MSDRPTTTPAKRGPKPKPPHLRGVHNVSLTERQAELCRAAYPAARTLTEAARLCVDAGLATDIGIRAERDAERRRADIIEAALHSCRRALDEAVRVIVALEVSRG